MATVGVKGLICITIEQFFKARRLCATHCVIISTKGDLYDHQTVVQRLFRRCKGVAKQSFTGTVIHVRRTDGSRESHQTSIDIVLSASRGISPVRVSLEWQWSQLDVKLNVCLSVSAHARH